MRKTAAILNDLYAVSYQGNNIWQGKEIKKGYSMITSSGGALVVLAGSSKCLSLGIKKIEINRDTFIFIKEKG